MDPITGPPLNPVAAQAPLPTSMKLEKFMELTKDTYETWACTAKANLIIGGYWPFFCGKAPRPCTGSEDWDRFNGQLVTVLQMCMHPTLQVSNTTSMT